MTHRLHLAIALLAVHVAALAANEAMAQRSPEEDRRPSRVESSYAGRSPQFHYSRGGAFAATARGRGRPLLSARISGDGAAAALAAKVERWAVANRERLGLAEGLRLRDLALAPADDPVFRDREVKIYRYDQTYRGLPVAGPGARLSVMVAGDRHVRAIVGRFVDQRPYYEGLGRGISAETARQKILAAWKLRDEGPGLAAPGGLTGRPPGGSPGSAPGDSVLVAVPPGPRVKSLEKVAVPEHRLVAWRGEVVGPTFAAGDTILGEVLVAAADGATIAVLPAAAATATVRAHEMENDPFTTAQRNYPNVPATTFGNTINFSPDVEGPDGPVECSPPSSREFRMGDSQRLSVFDLGGTLDDPQVPTVEACSANGEPFFGASNSSSNRFHAQDMLVKTYAALAVMDPLMGEMVTHGAEHTYSWSHHPDVPDLIHRPTLLLFANHGQGTEGCDDNPGIFRRIWAPEESFWFELLDTPVWHPNIFTDEDEALVGAISVCSSSFNGSLFHEIGHYYDAFSVYGVLGEGGPGYSECCLDRPNEARAMAESIAQLFGLFLMERWYNELDYTLSTMPAAGDACKLSSLMSHMPDSIVHPDCMDDAELIWTLNEKRPGGDDPDFGCNPSGSDTYGVHAQSQAFWSLLFGQQCSVVGDGVFCVLAHSPLPGGYSVRWMEALLAALQMGNQHSFVSLWDSMEAYIGANYPQDVDFLQSVRALHGLEPLPHGEDPDCDCPGLVSCG